MIGRSSEPRRLLGCKWAGETRCRQKPQRRVTFKTNLDELGHYDEIGNRPAPTPSHDGEIGNEPGQMTSQDDEIGNRPAPITSQDEQIGDESDGGSLPPDMPTNPTVPLIP